MNDLADRIRTLKALTQQQRRVLELLCERMTYRQVAAALGRGIASTHIERKVAQIFAKLGIRGQSNRPIHDAVREYELVLQFLEDHRKAPPGMSNAEIHEIQHAPDDGRDPEPPRWAVTQARQYGEELESGRDLPSLRMAGAGSSGPLTVDRGRTGGELTRWQEQPPTPPPLPRQGRSLMSLVLGGAAVLLIAILAGALVVALNRQPAPPIVVTATPAPVAQVAPTPTQPPVPTPTAIPPTATSVPPTATSAPPTATARPSFTPTAVAVSMIGRVANRYPGTDLELGTAVTSILDASPGGRDRDVYAIQLEAGKPYQFTIQGETMYLDLYNPGIIPGDFGNFPTMRMGGNEPTTKQFTPAVSGKFTIVISIYIGTRTPTSYVLSTRQI